MIINDIYIFLIWNNIDIPLKFWPVMASDWISSRNFYTDYVNMRSSCSLNAM